jgi:prepilin-type N-terminal cleavage/methylation domain-containing protein/prepilin-type processing-associated H-X9-DG protein
MKKRTRGFTLIELLVVIAIIAILAAILFPVFTQARAKARQISCLSNVKNISLAVLMYVDDWDGTFPAFWAGPPATETGLNFPNILGQYVGAPEILHCPADGNMSPTMGPAISYWAELNRCLGGTIEDYAAAGGIGYGWQSMTRGGGVYTCLGRPEASLPEPGNTIMLGCGQIDPAWWAWDWDEYAGVYLLRENALGQNVYCNIAMICDLPAGEKRCSGIYLHNYGSNFGFADGHAKWLKIEKCYYPSNLFMAIQPNPGGFDPFGLFAYLYGDDYLIEPW